jgi:hypothetical protein
MALTYEDLWNKAKALIDRAISKRDESAFDEFQLWASISLEILGKATLAKIHPVLVVNPEKFEFLLIACGHTPSDNYKTIMATTLFDRCKTVVKNFDKVAEGFCVEMANRRNADLHSGEVPFEGIAIDAWQPKYWQVTKLLLEAQGKKLEDYLGTEEAKAAEEIINDASLALTKAIEGRIRKHEAIFLKTYPENQRQQVFEHAQITINARLSHDETDARCPACRSPGIMTGEYLTREDRGSTEDEPWISEVENFFGAEDFECIVCGLKLVGVDEVVAAGFDSGFTKLDYKETDYEPDYGND